MHKSDENMKEIKNIFNSNLSEYPKLMTKEITGCYNFHRFEKCS